ncbi:MAG: 30S ribosomal protein S24e [Thermoplasmata archaeon]
MEIKILEERANPLLKRHEYRFEVAHATAPTPPRDEVRTELAKLVKAPKDRVIIERMNARFGTAITRGDANVYDSAESAKVITREHILVRNGLKEKVAKGPATPAAAEAPAEAPRAEPKAEPKVEHKPEHKPEHESEHTAEHKAEHKAEPKAEGAPAKKE